MFTEYYPGQPKMTGTFQNGLKNGEFVHYDNQGKVIKVEFYKEGKKHGIFKEYFRIDGFSKNLISKETYTNDTLTTGYYWHTSGQISKTIFNGDTTFFKIDSSIYTIIPYIEGINASSVYDAVCFLSKQDLCKSIDNLVSVAKLCFNDHEIETGFDTIPGSEFNVRSYYIGGAIYFDKNDGAHIDFDTGLILENNLNIEVKNKLCELYPGFLYFSSIIIVDRYNIEYELQDFRIFIQN